MKKQTEILTKTLTRPTSSRIQLIFLVIIATVFYRNYSNRRIQSGMPPNTLGYAKEALQSGVSELEKLVSTHSIFQFLAIAGWVVLLIVGIVYIIRTH